MYWIPFIYFCKKKRTFFFFYNQLRYIPFFSLRQLGAGKIKMRFHFVQVERDSVGHSPLWLQTSFSSLSLWKFRMRRWRMDTGHEDGRQQGKTFVYVFPSLATRVEKKCVFNNQIQVYLCRWKFSIILACEYSRFSLLLVAKDVSSGGTSAPQRQKFQYLWRKIAKSGGA